MINIPGVACVSVTCFDEKPTPSGTNRRKTAVILSLTLAALTAVFYLGYPYWGEDYTFFANVNWLNPYADPGFANPPWLIIVAPWILLPVQLGGAINRAVMLLVFLSWMYKYQVDKLGYLMLFTCPVFYLSFRFNNLDYFGLAALMVPAAEGWVFASIKPQVMGAAVLVWVKQHRWGLLTFNIVLVLSSFLIWGFWPLQMLTNGAGINQGAWNLTPFPLFPLSLVPGCWLLVDAWRNDDWLLAAMATPLLFPYTNKLNLPVIMAILLARGDYKGAGWLYGFMWYLTVL